MFSIAGRMKWLLLNGVWYKCSDMKFVMFNEKEISNKSFLVAFLMWLLSLSLSLVGAGRCHSTYKLKTLRLNVENITNMEHREKVSQNMKEKFVFLRVCSGVFAGLDDPH